MALGYNQLMFTSDHPLIGQLDHLTQDELSTQLAALHRKLNVARSTGNAYLVNQLVMAINSYQTAYQNRLRQDDGDIPFSSVIDIS